MAGQASLRRGSPLRRGRIPTSRAKKLLHFLRLDPLVPVELANAPPRVDVFKHTHMIANRQTLARQERGRGTAGAGDGGGMPKREVPDNYAEILTRGGVRAYNDGEEKLCPLRGYLEGGTFDGRMVVVAQFG